MSGPEVWWVAGPDGATVGPFTREELRREVRARRMTPQARVWSDSAGRWRTLAEALKGPRRAAALGLVLVLLANAAVFWTAFGYAGGLIWFTDRLWRLEGVVWLWPLAGWTLAASSLSGLVLWLAFGRALSLGQELRGVASIAVVICSIAGLAVAAFELMQEDAGVATLLASQLYTYEIGLDAERGVVEVSGSIGGGFSDALMAAVRKAPRPPRIEISSDGGLSHEALKAAKALERLADVTIVARELCASACLMVLAAGDERLAEADMALDYHATSALIAPDTRLAAWAVSAEAKAGDAFMLERGVPREVIETSNDAGAEMLLTISAAEALKLGILTGLVEGERRLEPIEIDDRFRSHPPRRLRTVDDVLAGVD